MILQTYDDKMVSLFFFYQRKLWVSKPLDNLMGTTGISGRTTARARLSSYTDRPSQTAMTPECLATPRIHKKLGLSLCICLLQRVVWNTFSAGPHATCWQYLASLTFPFTYKALGWAEFSGGPWPHPLGWLQTTIYLLSQPRVSRVGSTLFLLWGLTLIY